VLKNNEINLEVAKLIDLLDISKEQPSQVNSLSEFKNLKGTSEILNLGEVNNMKTYNTDGYGNRASAFIGLEEGFVGLSTEKYKSFQNVVIKILEDDHINIKVDFEYIKDVLFDWIINSYKGKRINQEFLNYLDDRILLDCKEYLFYFKILALAIESSFFVGEVEITHLSEDKIQTKINRLKDLKGMDQEELDGFFKEFKEPVLACCKSHGVKNKAQKNAMVKVELAINALKCFFINESLHISYQIFDVDFNFNSTDFSSFLLESNEKEIDFNSSLNRIRGTLPIIIDNNRLIELENSGLKSFSSFIKNGRSGSLYLEIINGINHLGEITATRNLYNRVVELISFFERFIVPKDKSKAYGQTRLKENILPKIQYLEKKVDFYRGLVTDFYKIRDRYLHNKIELPINLNDLLYFQRLGSIFLIQLMILNEKYSELEEILDFFGIKAN
jgi:hypothetical protein